MFTGLFQSDAQTLPHTTIYVKVYYYSADRNSKGVNFRNLYFLPPILIYYDPPISEIWKIILELFETFPDIALIKFKQILGEYKLLNFFVRLFHPPQFILPKFMIFQKINNPSQLFSPPRSAECLTYSWVEIFVSKNFNEKKF